MLSVKFKFKFGDLIMNLYLVAQLLEVLRVEEDESEEGPRHRPLVPAVLEHDDVQHCR